jgi:hypothetical protein
MALPARGGRSSGFDSRDTKLSLIYHQLAYVAGHRKVINNIRTNDVRYSKFWVGKASGSSSGSVKPILKGVDRNRTYPPNNVALA